MKYLKIFFCLSLMLFFMTANLFAAGLSELNITEFERDKDVRTDGTPSNPFAESHPSPEDMMVEDLFLNGVVVGNGRRYALISGHILTLGDTVAGLRVRSISGKKVVLQDLDRVHTLYLEGGY